MEKQFFISSSPLSFGEIEKILLENKKIALSDESKKLIQKCKDYLDNKLATNAGPVYGINTGFGALHNISISNEDLSLLQENLVNSHACGLGNEVRHDIVKLMMLLKIHALSLGNSGVQLQTVERLIDFFNNDVILQVCLVCGRQYFKRARNVLLLGLLKAWASKSSETFITIYCTELRLAPENKNIHQH